MDNWSSGGYDFDTQTNAKPEPSAVEQTAPPDASAPADEDDEMAAFEAACGRRLEEEHQRREQEAATKAAEAAASSVQEDTMEPEPEPPQEESPVTPDENPAPEPEKLTDNAEEPPAQEEPQEEPQEAELSAIMRAEAAERQRYEASEEAYIEDDDEAEGLPRWLRVIFTLLLLLLGAGGVYMMVGMDYHSYLLDPLCFAEISVCMLTAIGLNAARISSRIGKVLIMRTATWFLFLFYCLYVANELFLHRLLADHFVLGHFVPYARSHIAIDFSTLSRLDIAECVMLMLPFAFLLPMVLGFLRNVVLYVFGMVLAIGGVSVLRIVSMAGGVNMGLCCVALASAVMVYIIFMLPPLQNLLRNVGLASWEEIYYDDE